MKLKYFLISVVFSTFALLLSSCGGGLPPAPGWTGITLVKNIAYVASYQYVYAIDLQQRTLVWKYPDKADTRTFFSAPALVSNQLLVGSFDNKLYRLYLDRATGNVLTSGTLITTTGHVIASPVIISPTIFLAGSDSIFYISDLYGKPPIKVPTQGPLWSAPAYDSTTHTFFQASLDHHVYARSENSTKTTWDWTSEDLGGAILDTPTIGQDGIVYVGTLGSEIVALNGSTGKTVWKVKVGGWVWSSPALDNNRLYFGDLNNNIYAMNLPDQKIAWKITADGLVAAKPLVTKEAIYFATGAGSVYAYDRNGNQLWMKSLGTSTAGFIFRTPLSYLNSDGSVSAILIAPYNKDAILTMLNPSSGSEIWSFIPPK